MSIVTDLYADWDELKSIYNRSGIIRSQLAEFHKRKNDSDYWLGFSTIDINYFQDGFEVKGRFDYNCGILGFRVGEQYLGIHIPFTQNYYIPKFEIVEFWNSKHFDNLTDEELLMIKMSL